METTNYPARVDIDYPEHELSRLTTFFRIVMVIPVAIILGLVTGWTNRTADADVHIIDISVGLWLATALMLLFRQRYPRWWFDWQLALTRFSVRVESYAMLMRDEYPAVEDEQAVHVELDYPDAENDLNRWLPLVKWVLLLPHYLVLAFVSVACLVCVILAWFAVLFTGRYPRGLFDFNLGVLRWWTRVAAYGFLLITDEYPPFSLRP